MKALTYKQYRIINILLLTVIYIIIESAVSLGANLWFPELPYVLSLAIMFTGLEMMRWGAYAIVAALVSGIVTCLSSGANGEQFLIYVVGNLFMLAGLLLFKLFGKEKIRNSSLLTILYAVALFLLAEVGRGIVSIILGSGPLVILQFLTTDSLSGVFAVLVLLMMRNVEGMFEDQKTYLLRLEEERNKKKNQEF